MKLIREMAKAMIARRGYSYYKNESAAYGIDPFNDIGRLSRRLDYPIQTFFDVGANIGQTAVKAVTAFPSVSVVCFEPHPKTFAQLNGRMSEVKRVAVHNLALGSKSGRADLYAYELSDLNSLVPNSPYVARLKPEAQSVAVEVATLDEFCEAHSIDRIDVLKIDTEGFDAMVLRGAQGMLSRGAVKFVYTEFDHIVPREGISGGALSEVDQLLAPAGFRFVASYTDFVVSQGDVFASCNALFALSRS
jgi:FkbM family methyltransferase